MKNINKKGDWTIKPGVAFFILIIAIIILTMWIGSWECLNNSYCDIGEICTYQHVCLQPENVQNTVVKTEYKFTSAALILGLSLIIAAFIFKNKKLNLNIFKKK